MLHSLAEDFLDWHDDLGAPRDLTYLLVSFVKGCGAESMEEICHRLPDEYLAFARAQDEIGWRRFDVSWRAWWRRNCLIC
jgi:hypothetical protein